MGENESIEQAEQKPHGNDAINFEIYTDMREANQAMRDLNAKLIKAIKTIVVAFLVAIVLIMAGFLWYISLPIDDVVYTTEQNTDSGGHNYNNIGGELYGTPESDDTETQESGAK